MFKELSENPDFETVSVRRRARSCHSIKWRLTSARQQQLNQDFLSRREPVSTSSRVAEWAQAIHSVPSDTASTVVESVTTTTVVGSTVGNLPIIYEADNDTVKKKSACIELDGDNIPELSGDSAVPQAPSPPRARPVPKKRPQLSPSLDSSSASMSTTLHSPAMSPRSPSLWPGDSVSAVGSPVTPSSVPILRKPSARPIRPPLPECLIVGRPRSAVVSPLNEVISSSSCAGSPPTCDVFPPDDVVSPPSEAVLPLDEVVSQLNDVAALFSGATSSPNNTASPPRSTVSPPLGTVKSQECSETNPNPSSAYKAPKPTLKRAASKLLRRRKISPLGKVSPRKFKINRMLSFSEGDDLAFHVCRCPTNLKPSPDIPQDHIDVVNKAIAQRDMQPPESHSSSTEPNDGEWSSSCGGGPSSRTSLDGQRSESSTGDDSSFAEPRDGEGSSSSGGAPSSRTSSDSNRNGRRSGNSNGDDSSKRSASRESGESGGGNGSGDQGGSDDEQNRKRKKPRNCRETPVKKKFACLYYKFNPQVYGIHGHRRFRICQCTGYDYISGLR